VYPLVLFHVASLGKAHMPLGTTKGFHPCVNPLVNLHLFGSAEAFVTEHEEELFLFTIA
jgi:hypothetical protein